VGAARGKIADESGPPICDCRLPIADLRPACRQAGCKETEHRLLATGYCLLAHWATVMPRHMEHQRTIMKRLTILALLVLSAHAAFGEDARLPKAPAPKWADKQLGVAFGGTLAGLKFSGQHAYDNPKLGYSLRYQGTDLTKADIYVYDMGISGIPNGHDNKLVKSQSDSVGRELLIMQQRGYYNRVKQLGKGVVGTGPIRFAWTRFEFFQTPGRGRTAGMRVSESFVTGFGGKFIKIRLTYKKDNLAEGGKISPRLARDLADLLREAITIRDPKQAKFVIEVDSAMPKHLVTPWLAYLLARQAYVTKHIDRYDLMVGRMVPKFQEEVQGRKMLVRMWAGAKQKDKAPKDPRAKYLDKLTAVDKAGFMAEYVWTYLKQPAWTAQPKGLRLKEFAAWQQRNLPAHKARTYGGIRIQRKPARPKSGDKDKAPARKKPARSDP